MADHRLKLQQQLPFTLNDTDFPTLGDKYRGKVRDTYAKGDRLVLVTTDRLSAFDHILTTLPFKGDLLNTLAHFWFKKTEHIVKNHVLDMPDPCVIVGRKAQPFKIEFVVRAHLTGSLWRDYEAGRDPYALALPPGMKKDQAFEKALLTPSTKAPIGEHDEPLSEDAVVQRGIISARDWARAREAALALFAEGQKQARAQGLILVDTKYEFGLIGDELVVIDELHTPDSSRFWPVDEWKPVATPPSFDKQPVRDLLASTGWNKEPPPPPISDEVVQQTRSRYIEAYEIITGRKFSDWYGAN